MVTGYRMNRTVYYDLLSFLRNIGCTGTQFKILCLWGRHPKAKLGLYTLARTLDCAKIDLRDAIAALVGKNILVAQHDTNGFTIYSLSGDQRIQEYVDELAKLDWSETISLGRQLREEAVLSSNKR